MTNIQKHMLATFLSLRIGVGLVGIVFPLLLFAGGEVTKVHLAGSMSAYYHATRDCIDPRAKNPVPGCLIRPLPTGAGPMRNWFVGILFAVGICLYLIKGFSDWENALLTAAGVLAVCVALCPMPWSVQNATGLPIHYISAVTFFACIAFVCLFCSDKTLKYMPAIPNREKIIAQYKLCYRTLAFLMILSPITAYIVNEWLGQSSWLFFAEAFGIEAFGAYWLLKTKELSLSGVERRSLKGELDMDTSTLR